MTSHKESGMVIWYILAGVALFAALTFSFVRSANQSTGTMSKEQAQIAANDLMRYSEGLKQAVQRLRLVNGCSENMISFYSADWSTPADYDNANNTYAGGNFDCFIFQRFGGGQVWQKHNDYTLSGISDGWYVTSAFAVEGIGTADADLILMSRISEEVCDAVNLLAGISASYDAGSAVSTYTAPFTGSYTLVDTIGDAVAHSDLANESFGCLIDASDNTIFYDVLLDR